MIGFYAGAIVWIFHLPLPWLDMMNDSAADLPSHMMHG
jgi:hypothetical protein